MNELNRWCPALRVIRFHGSKEEREHLKEEYFTNEAAAHDGRRPDKKQYLEKGEWTDDNSENPRAWDVCVSTYEVCNAERKTLQKFASSNNSKIICTNQRLSKLLKMRKVT